MSTTSTPDHLLGATARWTASVRALESARDDRLFDDPWEATPAGLSKSRRTMDSSWARSCRGKEAVLKGTLASIVILAVML